MYNFYRVGAAVPTIKLADTIYNAKQIIDLIKNAESFKVQILLFPELALTGYSCQDLFKQATLLESAEKSLYSILEATKDTDVLVALGTPMQYKNKIFNCTVFIKSGDILCIVKKSSLTIEERRFFCDEENFEFEINYCNQKTIFLEKPIFVDQNGFTFSLSYSGEDINLNNSNIVLCPDATCASGLKTNDTELEAKLFTKKNNNCVVYANAGFGESTTDFVFDGKSLVSENGKLKAISKPFSIESTLIYADVDLDLKTFSNYNKPLENQTVMVNLREDNDNALNPIVNANPFLPMSKTGREVVFNQILNIQKMGLVKRFVHTNSEKLVIGISGGLDSTLSLIVSIFVMDTLHQPRTNILGISMPGFGTSNRTYQNSKKLMELLKISSKEISIVSACEQHFKDIEQDINKHDITFENAQARERTQVLLDVANMENALVVGTGDFTELALGFATYNGDHMSSYSVNSNIPKNVVKEIIKYIYRTNIFNKEVNDVLMDITKTHISPELLPADKNGNISQITESVVGPYELNDFYLYYVLKHGYSPSKIIFMAESAFLYKYTKLELIEHLSRFYKRFITQQFKRSCLPDGPQVFDFSLSPRNGYLMPSDACFNIWINELKIIKNNL